MSSEFQQTLHGNPMLSQAKELHYHDKITLKHKTTDAYLHSHLEKYPLKYDDGRVSSQGQQVTGYPFNDTNNVWEIVPAYTGVERKELRHMDQVRLLHVNSDSYLLAHDVASPLMATNEEFTTWPANDETRINETLFELQVDGAASTSRKIVKSKSTWFRLIHTATRVCLWTHTETPLPEWGFNQQEVNGHKNALEKTGLWFVDDLYPNKADADYEERMKPLPPRKVTKMNFFRKFFELQMQMLQQNAHLTQSHPYASSPINWPFSLTGISFWTQNDELQQIYLVGNLASWWTAILSVSVLVGILAADALARRRGFYPIQHIIRNRLINSTGFFLVAWAWHYLPFFLMSRQLFLHHYLPAHVCGCLVAGSIVNFIGSETIDYPISRAGPLLHPSAYIARGKNVIPLPVKLISGAIVGATIVVFWHLAPLTYGTPGLGPEAIDARLWLSWQLHFRKTVD
jgi:dolichyl-phosphate-mannose-protein mannosyltransferase